MTLVKWWVMVGQACVVDAKCGILVVFWFGLATAESANRLALVENTSEGG